VAVIIENFLPGEAETEKAKRIVMAYEEARKAGSGVVALDSKMIDLPVVRRALKTIEKAVGAGKIPKNWRDDHEG
jgi:citrate lyase subunit beta/citryl-CoA lyase